MKNRLRTMAELERDILQARLDRLAECTHRAVFRGREEDAYQLAVATVRARNDVRIAEADVANERMQLPIAA